MRRQKWGIRVWTKLQREEGREKRVRTDDREVGGVRVSAGQVLGDAGVLAGVVGLDGADAEDDRVVAQRDDGDARLDADRPALVRPVDSDRAVALHHLARHRHRLTLAHRLLAEREGVDARRHLQIQAPG